MLPSQTQRRFPLHWQILAAIGIGALTGYLTGPDATLFGVSVVDFFDFLGTLFVNALKMLVVPLIVASVIFTSVVFSIVVTKREKKPPDENLPDGKPPEKKDSGTNGRADKKVNPADTSRPDDTNKPARSDELGGKD